MDKNPTIEMMIGSVPVITICGCLGGIYAFLGFEFAVVSGIALVAAGVWT